MPLTPSQKKICRSPLLRSSEICRTVRICKNGNQYPGSAISSIRVKMGQGDELPTIKKQQKYRRSYMQARVELNHKKIIKVLGQIVFKMSLRIKISKVKIQLLQSQKSEEQVLRVYEQQKQKQEQIVQEQINQQMVLSKIKQIEGRLRKRLRHYQQINQGKAEQRRIMKQKINILTEKILSLQQMKNQKQALYGKLVQDQELMSKFCRNWFHVLVLKEQFQVRKMEKKRSGQGKIHSNSHIGLCMGELGEQCQEDKKYKDLLASGKIYIRLHTLMNTDPILLNKLSYFSDEIDKIYLYSFFKKMVYRYMNRADQKDEGFFYHPPINFIVDICNKCEPSFILEPGMMGKIGTILQVIGIGIKFDLESRFSCDGK